MIIKTASQIISEIIKIEKRKIDGFSVKIRHAPTIGKQYEGMTKKALNYSVPDALNIRVVSGFVKNSKGELSGQIDCMICFGEGALVPGTIDEYVYEIKQVIAVIEIKKNLFTNELHDSHKHLLGIKNLICDFESLSEKHADIINTTFAKATGKLIINWDDIEGLNDNFLEMIYHGLVAQFIMPLRIVIGYDGFSTEKSLREKFVSYIESKPKTKGYGPFSLPDLILCGESCLIKLNGEPYPPIIEHNFLEFYASSAGNNIKILTELVFSRLARYASFDFTEDDEQEKLKYYLATKLFESEGKIGWEYVCHPFGRDKSNHDAACFKWKPEFISKTAYIIFNYLCKEPINIESDYFKQAKKDEPNILEQLLKTKFVAINNNTLYLISYSLQCVILPTGEYVVADDNYGYFSKWFSERSKGQTP